MAEITANTIFIQGDKFDITPSPSDGEYIVNSKVVKGSTHPEDSSFTDASIWDAKIRLPWNIIKIPESPNFDNLSIHDESGIYTTVKPEKIVSEKSTLKVLNDNDVSQAMLRTNPRLTGNVKVVIDSNSDIFIDTFKVNDVLANKKYHKVPVSYKDYYGKNLMSIFNKMTSKDFYDIPNKYKELFTVTSKWEDQYVTTYESGCQTNQDKLYSENFSLLSPLYINHVLPDFFVIFRIDNVGEFTFDKLVEKGKQIAVYDFRDGTKLGTYLRTIQKNAEKYNDGIFISTPTSQDPDTYYENCITGISIDKGVITQQYESAQRNPATNDVWNHYYFIQAYGNHRIVHPRLINFEFMFDDNTSKDSQFEVNTYFGVYLYANREVENIHTTIKDGKVIWINDETDDSTNQHVIYDSTDLDSRIIADASYIAAYTSDGWFQRIYNDTKRSELESKKGNVGKNLLYLNAKPVNEETSKGIHSFLTMTLNTKIKAGEHYKFISYPKSTVKNDIVIFEIAFTNAERYKSMQISDMHTTYYSHSYSRGDNTGTREIITYRIACYVGKDDTIEKQISNIRKIMLKFDDTPFRVTYTTENTICICYTGENDMEFQRISSEYASDNNAIGSIDETKLNKYIGRKDITFFGDVNTDEFPINPLDENNTVYDSYRNGAYVPIDFENLGARLSLNAAFIDVNSTTGVKGNIANFQINRESINKTGDLLYGELSAKSNELIYDTGGKDSKGNIIYKPIENVIVNKYKIKTKVLKNGKISDKIVDINLIDSYTGKNIKLVQLYTIETPEERKDAIKLGLYLPYYINYGRCGFMPICDFDFIMPKEDWLRPRPDDTNIKMCNYIKLSYVKTKNDKIQSPISEKFIYDAVYVQGQRYSDISYITPENITWNYYDASVSTDTLNGVLSIDGEIKRDPSIAKPEYSRLSLSNLDHQKLNNFTLNTKTDLLNGTINIGDIVQNNTKKIKLYKTDQNTLEFIYFGIKWKLSIINTEILNQSDINNMYIYIYKAYGFPGTGESDIFISKPEKKILIIYYTQNEVSESTITPNYNIYYLNAEHGVGGDIIWEGDELKIEGVNIERPNNNTSYLIYSNNFTLYYYYENNPEILIKFKYGNEPSDEEQYKKYIKDLKENIQKYVHGNDELYIYEITDSSIFNYNTKSASNYSEYIKNGDEPYNNYVNASLLDINFVIIPEKNPKYYTYFYLKTNKVLDFSNSTNIIPASAEKLNYKCRKGYKKYSENSNYCFMNSSNKELDQPVRYSFDTILTPISASIFTQKSIFLDSDTSDTIARKYSTLDTGIMIKNFLNSPALLLKNKYHNTITLNNWENIHTSNGKIYFNVTSALTKKISSSDGLSRLFKSLGTENGKQIFIDNTILPKIHLSINDTITVYKKEYSGSLYSSTYSNDMIIDKNAKAELILQNNVYYVELTPSDTNKTYYITYTNKLT